MAPSRRIIGFINIAHFFDHYSMLIFPAALIVMSPAFGLSFGEFLPYATPGFIAFGAGSLVSGWLGDRWSRRAMMLVYYFGIGLSLIACGMAQTPLQTGAGLFLVGTFASIYHPVGGAMLAAHAEKLGKTLGLNGIFGNFGVAFSALVTGVLCEYLGWRYAFIVPGALVALVGLAFLVTVSDTTSPKPKAARKTTGMGSIPGISIRRIFVVLLLTAIGSSVAFNAITVALPRLFTERLDALTADASLLGLVTAGVYLCGAVAQYTIGGALDRFGVRAVFIPMSCVLAPSLALGSLFSGWALILCMVGAAIAVFGQVVVNDAMVGRYVADEFRGRVYAVRYFVGFGMAGAAVAMVGFLHDHGGFGLTFQVLAGLACLIILAGLILPRERVQEAAPAVAE